MTTQTATATAAPTGNPEVLISRSELGKRWGLHPESIKRREKLGILTPLHLSRHSVRYRLSQVLRIEAEAQA